MPGKPNPTVLVLVSVRREWGGLQVAFWRRGCGAGGGALRGRTGSSFPVNSRKRRLTSGLGKGKLFSTHSLCRHRANIRRFAENESPIRPRNAPPPAPHPRRQSATCNPPHSRRTLT